MKRATRRLITALLLGVALYGVAIAYTGFREMRDSLSSFHWSAFAAAVALASMNYLLRFVRWDYYLKLLDVRGVGKGDSLLLFLSGFVLTITPGKVGEVFKSAVLNQTHGVPIARTAPVVIAERLTDLIGVVALIFLGSIGFESGGYWAIAGAAVIVFALAMIMWRAPLDYLLAWVSRHPRFGRFAPKLREAIESLRLLAGPSAIAWPMLLSIVAWACEGIALWVLLVGFGTRAPLLLSVFFYETASLAGALIPIPGGLGVVEGMIREQLVRLGGASTTVATASMILVRFATLWWAVAVGFIALAILRARYPKLRGVEP
jgi:glycosyltransferase 2 family protein